MREGTASHTARSVAARRLEYARAEAAYGDPAADEALARDVADGLTPRRDRMHEYIRARTAFFDRVVVNSLDRGITQVVVGGAGYDGRAFRYARPGVRWFEVDHPATQADKLDRLARLGLDAAHIRFIPADFTVDTVAAALTDAGLDPARPALFLFEGVAVYLDRPVIDRVLAGFRAVTVAGSPLAISVSVGSATSATRARFQERVAALGEPARTVLTPDQAGDLLRAAGWELGEASDRQRSAGLLLARAAATSDPERLRPPLTRPASPPGAAEEPETAASHPGTAAAEPGAVEQGTVEPGTAEEGTVQRRAVPLAGEPDPAALPLSALLSQALVAFTIEADNEAEHLLPHRTTGYRPPPGPRPGGPWLTSLLMWANCLRHLPDEGITIAELRSRARTGTNLDGMRRWGYVTFTPDPGHGKRPREDALIRPTAWGIAARDTWHEVTAEVESRWRARLGTEAFTALRAALAGVVAHLDPALPDCLPILGFGLFTRRRGPADVPDTADADPAAAAVPPGPAVPSVPVPPGPAVPVPPGPAVPVPPGPAVPVPPGPAVPPVPVPVPAGQPARVPAPVPAGQPAPALAPAVAGLPLWALLSRCVLAFARQYEAEPGPSLAVSADILRVLTEAGVRTKDIPALGGVSKESVAMAMGVLRQTGLVTEGPDPAAGRFKLTRLTPRGALARDEYPALAADIERDWRTRFGDTAVTALRQVLEPLLAGDPPPLSAGLAPYQDNWRAQAKPPATLPHYPMTLHRGGFPDGS